MHAKALSSRLLMALTGVFLFVAPLTPSMAQTSGDEKIAMDEKFAIAELGMALFRAPDLGGDYAVLSLSSLNKVMTSCIKLKDFGYETNFQDIYFNIILTDVTINKENMPSAPHIECNANTQNPKAEIILSKENLRENKTKTIMIQSDPLTQYFDLELTDDYIELLPSENFATLQEYFKGQKLYGRKESLKMWFYPEDTVILYMPGKIASGTSVKGTLDALAKKHGLVPLESRIESFKSPLTDPNQYYYIDTTGRVAAKIGETGGAFLDNLKVETMSYELSGDVPVLKDVAVYARKPGMND